MKTRKRYKGTALHAAVASKNDQAAIRLMQHKLFKPEWLSEKGEGGKTVVELAKEVGATRFLTAVGQMRELRDVHAENMRGRSQCLIS
jgi:hypothetical protein